MGASCVELWRNNQHHPDPFLADPAWAAAALNRLTLRPGTRPENLPGPLEQRLFDELLERYESSTSFGLVRRQLADRLPKEN